MASVFAGTKRALPFLTVAMLGHERFRAQLGLVDVDCFYFDSTVGARLGADSGHLFARNSMLPGSTCRWSAAGWRAATTRPVCGHAGHAGGRRRAILSCRPPQKPSTTAPCADALDALVLVREVLAGIGPGAEKALSGLLSMFARLGEQTEQLPVMLQRAARKSPQVQRRALQLATILEPLLIVGMGLIVMTIVLAVM